MKGAMVVTWTGNRPGRERQGLAYAREVDEFFGRFAAEGKCTSPKWFFAQTGPSVWLVEGEMEDLLMISASPEGQKLAAEGSLFSEGWTVELCSTDRDTQFRMFEGILDELSIN